ncbi:hypothetical protein [Aeromonas phage 85AhydR10PP]|nr:hypothetical protein [Aeromonas phage 85AhydR10PP]
MPTLKIVCMDQRDADLKHCLCPDEAHRFTKWLEEVEARSRLDESVAARLVAKGLKYRDWFDMFNHGITPLEAVCKEGTL